MICPICTGDLDCFNTRPYKYNRVWRRKRCEDCGAVFTTIEKIFEKKKSVYHCRVKGCMVRVNASGDLCSSHRAIHNKLLRDTWKNRTRVCTVEACGKKFKAGHWDPHCVQCRNKKVKLQKEARLTTSPERYAAICIELRMRYGNDYVTRRRK